MLSWYWIVFFVFAFILFLILITKTKIEVLFQRHGDENDYLLIKVTLLKYLSIKKEFPMLDLVNEDNYLGLQFKSKNVLSGEDVQKKINLRVFRRALSKMKLLIKNLHHVLFQLRKLFKGFKIETFQWTTHIGIDDAAILGPTIGGVWAVKGTLLQQMFYYFPLLSRPHIQVNPEYQQNLFKTKLHCIIQFKVGYAIYAGIKLLYMYRKGVRHV